MSVNGLTRGPLPPSVYWRRRLVVLLVALTLVLGIGRLLGMGSDGSDGSAAPVSAPGGAQLAGTQTSEEPTGPLSDDAAASEGKPGKAGKPGKKASQALAVPVGSCRDDDISVTPTVQGAEAGRDVTITLEVRTLLTPACTWSVSAQHLTLKITSDGDDVWSTLQCPKAITPQSVVVRSAVATTVQVVWGGRRSDDRCSNVTDWVLPGTYDLDAAALGGEPADTSFVLARPTAAVVTRTADPTPRADPSDSKTPKDETSPSAQQSDSPDRSKDRSKNRG